METDLHLEMDEVTLSGSAMGQRFSQPVVQLLPQQQETLELLSHLASYSELLIVVSGSTGIGKTTLATALSAQREDPEDTLSLNADLMTSQMGILTAIAGHWDLPQLSDNLAEAKNAVKQAADQRYTDGRSTLVVIDQAEQLDTETLNDIAHLALLSPQALSFALFGTRGFEQNLRQSPTLAPVHVVKPDPLTEEAAQHLSAQVFGADALSDEQIASAHQNSAGLPLLFLRELEDVLLAPGQTTQAPGSEATNRFPLTHIVAACGVAVALAMSFLYQSDTAEPELSPEDALLATLEAAEAKTETVLTPAIIAADMALDRNSTDIVANPSEAEVTSTASVTATAQPSVAAQSSVAKSQSNSGSQPALQTQPESRPDFNYQPAQQPVKQPAKTEEQTQSQAVVSPPLSAEPVIKKRSPAYSANERALLKASGFVAQLSGFYNIAGAETFIARWKGEVGSDLFLYKSQHKGKDWHVVVAGIYPDRATATKAVAAMPKPLRSQTPWIKDVQSVKKILSNRQ